MIRLIPSDATRRQIADFLGRADELAAPTQAAVQPIQEAIRAGFAANFATEGASGGAPWAGLAAMTQRERERQGYPAAHPILQRSGDYRASFTQEGHAEHVSEWIEAGGVWLIEEGSSDYRAKYHEPGGDIIPRRPVTVLGPEGEARIGYVLEQMFDSWFEG